MKLIKQLPLTMAVIAALCPISVLAQEPMTQEQIDQIVAKAVDKALADRDAKIEAARLKRTDTLVTPQVPTTADKSVPLGLKFTGYARYGAHFQAGDQKYIGVDGSYNGSSAIGRLGNEGNGGEFQLTKIIKGDNGAI